MTAIAFPFESALLEGAGEAPHETGHMRDKMKDGTPKIRAMQTDNYAEIPLAFRPYENKEAADFVVIYLEANMTQEFELNYMNRVYSGYLWSRPITERRDGAWWITITFYGRLL